jgi:hypothetical protein
MGLPSLCQFITSQWLSLFQSGDDGYQRRSESPEPWSDNDDDADASEAVDHTDELDLDPYNGDVTAFAKDLVLSYKGVQTDNESLVARLDAREQALDTLREAHKGCDRAQREARIRHDELQLTYNQPNSS